MKKYLYLLVAALLMLGCSKNKPMAGDTEDSMMDMAGNTDHSMMETSSIPKLQKSDKQLDAAEIDKILEEAEMSRKKAASLKHEWRHTSKYIKEAKQNLKDGKLGKAQKLAHKALLEAQMALWQAAESKKTWMISVPH